MFGFAYPKLRAVASLLDALTTSDVWDKVWAVIGAEEKAQALTTLTRVRDLDAPSTCESVGEWWGSRPHTLVDASARRSPAYLKTQRGIMGILIMSSGFAALTSSQTDDGYVSLVSRLVWENFDEAWAIEHPDEA
jgi:hypothetical protein